MCLLYVNTEELAVLITLRVKGFMKSFFNFEAITFFDFARKLTLKRNRHSSCIKFFHPFINVFLCSHANFY